MVIPILWRLKLLSMVQGTLDIMRLVDQVKAWPDLLALQKLILEGSAV